MMMVWLLFLKKVAVVYHNYLKEQFTAMLNVVHSIKYVGIQVDRSVDRMSQMVKNWRYDDRYS